MGVRKPKKDKQAGAATGAENPALDGGGDPGDAGDDEGDGDGDDDGDSGDPDDDEQPGVQLVDDEDAIEVMPPPPKPVPWPGHYVTTAHIRFKGEDGAMIEVEPGRLLKMSDADAAHYRAQNAITQATRIEKTRGGRRR